MCWIVKGKIDCYEKVKNFFKKKVVRFKFIIIKKKSRIKDKKSSLSYLLGNKYEFG